MMKKILVTIVLLLVVCGGVSAKEPPFRSPKRHYIHLAYANQEVEMTNWLSLKSDLGAALESGSTFFFNNRRPVAGMIRFGLDFSYLDLQLNAFRPESLSGYFDNNWLRNGFLGDYYDDIEEYWDDYGEEAWYANVGMQIGPSVTITPVSGLHIKGYVHYAPSLAAFSPDGFDDFQAGYAGHVTAGIQASYRFLTLGVEVRNATADLDLFGGDETFLLGDNVKLPGTRFLLGFRF